MSKAGGSKIPCADPGARYLAHKKEINAAVAKVLAGGRYILGPEVEAFEREFAKYIGVDHAVGVGSGTEAIHAALKACGIGEGDEVLTVSHTAVATAAGIELAGARPVFVDIDPGTYTMDPGRLEAAVGPRTRAVVPVHLYGQCADMAPILEVARRRGLKVIEDCCQAHGALYGGVKAGSFGDAACFSFYPTKNLGGFGDGGMIVTRDAGIAKEARLLREYGWAERYVSHVAGWNSRLDEIQAAILRVGLKHLDASNKARAAAARRYLADLQDAGLGLPAVRKDSTHVWHLFVVRSRRRDALKAALAGQGIGTLIHYPVPVHLQPAYRQAAAGARLPETEKAAGEILSLPMYPELRPAAQRRVIASILKFTST